MQLVTRITAGAGLLTALPVLAGEQALRPFNDATGVPIDAPWVLAAMAVSLAVVGVRLAKNRRK
ncbi:MAG: hypothetical protein AAGI11_19715 [Pseudomonadota bacterium]